MTALTLLGGRRPVLCYELIMCVRFEDVGEPDFRDAFVRIAGLEHHITTQAAYWIDSLGGGESYQKYHGAG